MSGPFGADTVSESDPAEIAIPKLLEEHGGRMFGLALRMCGSPEKAEDLVQETFLQAFRKWDQFEGRSQATTWLYTIAARLCGRMHRKRSGEPNRIKSLDALLPFHGGDSAGVPEIPADEDGPLARQLRAEAVENVERTITNLPATFRLPLVLKDIIGFSVTEVAEVLGLKEATVKTRLHRARLALREELSRQMPQREASPTAYSRRVCMDLLRAKQEALDRGAPFPLETKDFCDRCSAVFASMDLAKDVCEDLGSTELPATVRRAILEDVRSETR
ncbi:MAG: RNA polymerase sigma factor [Phycisphaerales bacterium]|nr:MAG: RNA polymerase sigma factor [Phycisphaerales bacterium]